MRNVPNGALIRYLESVKALTGGWEITDAIASVAQFGTNAKPAVPILIGLLKHSDHDVRSSVTNYLPRIDPEAAERAHLIRR